MEQQVMTLNHKKKCDECGLSFRHIEPCKDGKHRCRRCKKKMVTNIFYIPFKESIGKYSLSDLEKRILHKELMNKGMDSCQAWKEISRKERMLRWVKKMNRINYYKKLKKEKEEAENETINKKKFIEGLK